jgi:(2Fe-2S) ferredoxin
MTAPRRYCLLVCDGPSCGVTHDSDRLFELARRTAEAEPGLRAKVTVRNYTCFGRCDDGPNTFVVQLEPGDDPQRDPDFAVLESQRGFYPGMDEAKIVRVLEQHCGKDEVVEDLVDRY